MRTVRVVVTWTSVHDIEVPSNQPRIGSSDIESVLKHEDVTSGVASMTDWEIEDSEIDDGEDQ